MTKRKETAIKVIMASVRKDDSALRMRKAVDLLLASANTVRTEKSDAKDESDIQASEIGH